MAQHFEKGVLLKGVSPEARQRSRELCEYLETDEGKKMMTDFFKELDIQARQERRHCCNPFCPFCRPELYDRKPFVATI